MLAQLLSHPLFWTAATICAFLAGQQVYRVSHNSPLLPPILTAVILLVSALHITHTPYQHYMESAEILHLMLGPVIVMLAIPLYQFVHTMRSQWRRIFLAVSVGSFTTIGVAMLLGWWWIGDEVIIKTLATKSITTPVAVTVAGQTGGIAALASAFVIITGILGAIMVPLQLRWCRQDDPQTTGLALGVCAHAVGTSRAIELGPQQAAYSAMAMTLTATLHAIVLPSIL